jgi:anti-sigma factor RsiW
MSHPMMCTDNNKESIVGYLYGELAPGEQRAFESHLKTCAACRDEVAALGGVRDDLLAWAPPECRDLPSSWSDAPIVDVTPMARVRAWMPAFGLAAAAMLVLAVSAANANIEIRYDANGLAVRTGRTASDPAGAAPATEMASVGSVPGVESSATVTPDDLAALERRVMQTFSASNTSRLGAQTVALTSDNPQLSRDVRRLIEESERRTREEMANQFLAIVGDLEGYRRADMLRVQQMVNQIQSRTGADLAQTREAVRLMLASQNQTPQR